jgi:glycosyltransferase involved in cell wall biosynthesis
VRIAVLIDLAPRKLGSLEDWLAAFARVARRAGHSVDIYGREPIHGTVLDELRAHGAGWYTIDALARDRSRAVLKLARYDVVHATLFGLRDLPLLLAYAAWPARVLVFDQNSDAAGPIDSPSALRQLLNRAFLLRINGLAGVSNYVRDRLAMRFNASERIRTIYHGVNLARYVAPATRRSSVGDVHILTAAWLIGEKGVDHLIRAMASPALHRARLSIAGDGPELESLRRLSDELGVAERTRFLGLRTDLSSLLQEADIFVHPAVWQEAFGLTIAEAMATACPVVGSRVGAIPELVVDGVTGLLVPPGDSHAIAGALERLAMDPELRNRLGQSARRRAEEMFDLETCVEHHLEWCVSAQRHSNGRARIV